MVSEELAWKSTTDGCYLSVRTQVKENRSHLHNHGHSFLSTPRTFSSPHLQNNTTNAPDINLCIVAPLSRIDNLRCHPEHSALHGSENILFIDVVGSFRNTKVRNLADARLLNQDIIGLEILLFMISVTQRPCKSTCYLLYARYPWSEDTPVQKGFVP
jgi:hypothetical protein